MKTIPVAAEDLPLSVTAVGFGWLAVDKPAGLSVHNDPGRDVRSRLGALLAADGALRQKVGFDESYGAHAVHRLDRETSGLLLFACRREVFRDYARQFESRQVVKRYAALLHGQLMAPPGGGWHVWSWPLSAQAGGRRLPAGAGRRVPCITRVRVVRGSSHYTLAQCDIATGRIHQIRRHAKLAGHPVVGDRRYGSLRAIRFLETRHGFRHLGLHALALCFVPFGRVEAVTLQTDGPPPAWIALLAGDTP
jgi:23S rRNA-/tRNA-specific pseudouridylate synthase